MPASLLVEDELAEAEELLVVAEAPYTKAETDSADILKNILAVGHLACSNPPQKHHNLINALARLSQPVAPPGYGKL